MKIAILLVTFGVFAGCAGNPQPKEATPPKEMPKPVATATIADPTAEKILSLQRQGYKIVNRDGQILYCRTEKKTGTQIARETVCMTEKEADALRDLTQRRLDEFVRQRPPPQGK
jgi:hypothetical protein